MGEREVTDQDRTSFDVARRAFAVDTDDDRRNFEIIELAADNAIEVDTLAGVPGRGARVTIGLVPWKTPLWLARYFRDDRFPHEEYLFTDRADALRWGVLRVAEIADDEWVPGEEPEGWPSGAQVAR